MKVMVERMPDDWMAHWLREREVTVLNPDGSNSIHRVQVICVRRDDIEYEEQTDLGEAAGFDHEPLMVAAGGLTSVGRVRDIASRERGEKTFAEAMGLEVPDILGLYRQYATEVYDLAHHRSTFSGSVVRIRS